MEKEKRIKEMARIMCGGCIENELMTCSFTHEEIPCDFANNFAEALYNAGYRKQEDILHEWVERETAYLNEIAELKKKVEICEESHYITYERAKKETAKEIECQIRELFFIPFEGKTEKQKYQRKGMEEGLEMALSIVKGYTGVEVD